jgi:hypothetical protein
MTVAFIFFNVLLFIIISALGQDGYNVGTPASSVNIGVDENITESTTISYGESKGWFSGFVNTLYNLPWWINTLFVVGEFSVLTIIILAWLRGL